MAQNQTCCPRCGSTMYHFSQKKMKLVCDICTTPWDYLQDEKKKMEYTVNFAKGMTYLKSGFYTQAYSLLSPLTAENLTNKALWYAILRCLTEDFTKLDPGEDKAAISRVWKNLVMLNYVSDDMRHFAQRVFECRREKFAAEKMPLVTYIFVSGGLFIVAGILFSMHRWFWGSLGLLFAIGFFSAIFGEEPRRIAKRAELFIQPDNWNEDPFKNDKK